MKSSNEPYKKVAYEPLADSTVSITSSPPHWRSKLLHFGAGGLTTLLLALAAFAIQRVAFAPATTAEIEAEAWNYCGRSSAVARERGCVMEPLFYGWMPPACVFPELTAAHPIFEDRPWYGDKNMTIPLRPEELWAGVHTMIRRCRGGKTIADPADAPTRYHGAHCLFQWRKLQYAVTNRMDFLDNKTVSMHHTKHCADQLEIGCEGPHDVNEVELGFYRCRKMAW